MHCTSLRFSVVYGYCLTLIVVGINGLPNGAPDGACTTLMPRHQAMGGGGLISAQTGDTPFTVMTSSQTYRANQFVRVWINDNRASGTTGYRGLLLQARTVGGNTPLGMWRNAPNNTKLMMCTTMNDAVTHSNTNFKSNTSVYEWTPSGNHSMIEFTVTVAESREVFWFSLKSQALQYSGATAVSMNRFHVILIAVTATLLHNFTN